MHETSVFFHSIITFSYTKYYVHSYTVDVIFALSYNDISVLQRCVDIVSSILRALMSRNII